MCIDDLELAPDFLDYFQRLYPLLIHDKTLWCISAWNDNGIDKKIARDPSKRKQKSLARSLLFVKLFFIEPISFLVWVGY